MKPRYNADFRVLLWAYVLFPLVVLAPYADRRWLLGSALLSLYVGFCAGVLVHYQSHCPLFSSRMANAFHATWLSVFYGYPMFAWLPTHGQNHHKYLDGPGDVASTRQHSRDNTWLAASTYFFFSATRQGPLIAAYERRARRVSPVLHRRIVAQKAVFWAAHATMWLVAIGRHGAALGTAVYAGTFGVSAAAGLWSMAFFNFIQHVHCDPQSSYDHSRNFVSKVSNWLAFNSGYHTVHHERPGAHWSTLPMRHAQIEEKIHPELLQASIVWFCVRTYVLGAALTRLRTQPISVAP